MKLTIGYVGLTHLGINYAIASAMKGFKVICYDNNLDIISSLKKKKIPFYEKNTVFYTGAVFNASWHYRRIFTCYADHGIFDRCAFLFYSIFTAP